VAASVNWSGPVWVRLHQTYMSAVLQLIVF
jgi:hypothetical protein